MLKKNLGCSVADEDKTYVFGKEFRELSLTQHDEMKSVFPTHLVLIDSKTGHTLIDQLFHMPEIVEICYMSVPAFRRFRRITHHYRAPAKEVLWKAAAGNPVSSFLAGDRVRRADKKGEKPEDNDHFLTRDAKQVEPLLVSSADRSSDCVNRTHKKLPCYCLSEGIWFTKQHCLMLVWDTNDLESVGVPHNDADIVIFCVNQYLPVRWNAENAKCSRKSLAISRELELTQLRVSH